MWLEVGGDEKQFAAEFGCFLNNFMLERWIGLEWVSLKQAPYF